MRLATLVAELRVGRLSPRPVGRCHTATGWTDEPVEGQHRRAAQPEDAFGSDRQSAQKLCRGGLGGDWNAWRSR